MQDYHGSAAHAHVPDHPGMSYAGYWYNETQKIGKTAMIGSVEAKKSGGKPRTQKA